jgi:hypothetical protein
MNVILEEMEVPVSKLRGIDCGSVTERSYRKRPAMVQLVTERCNITEGTSSKLECNEMCHYER